MLLGRLFKRFIWIDLIVLSSAIALSSSWAQDQRGRDRQIQTPRFTLVLESQNKDLNHNSKSFPSIASIALELLEKQAAEINRVFSIVPKSRITLRLIKQSDYAFATGAPQWTSAMFYNGEISIPYKSQEMIDISDLEKSIRHEYVHAVVAELSNYGAPAWIDEGLAQYIEGQQNRRVSPALRNWARSKEIFSLASLHDGFLDLTPELAAVAYGESLFAAKTLINRFGVSAIRKYLMMLSQGRQDKKAFHHAFGISKNTFEKELSAQIKLWASLSKSEI